MLSDKFLRDRYKKMAEEIGVRGGQGRSSRAVMETAHGCLVLFGIGAFCAAVWVLIYYLVVGG